MQKFEKLLDKLIKEGKLDKVDLFRKLGLKSGGGSDSAGLSNQLIANSVQSSQPKTSHNILDDREMSQSNDMLLDEHIMGEEGS